MIATEQATWVDTGQMYYEPAESQVESGVRGREREPGDFIEDRMVLSGGNGTYVTTTLAHFILEVEVDGQFCGIWTERTFRRLLGIRRLTKRIRDLIIEHKPIQVQVFEKEGWRGTKYYALSEESAKEWAQKVREWL